MNKKLLIGGVVVVAALVYYKYKQDRKKIPSVSFSGKKNYVSGEFFKSQREPNYTA